MRTFRCRCGARVFFDNSRCLTCNRALGFDPGQLEMVSIEPEADGVLRASDGAQYRYCGNQQEHGNCNWLLPASSADSLCLSCAMNDVIPALSRPHNKTLWTRVEEAKRRLVYSILRYRLPLEANGQRLNFRILEDQRRNPDVLESFVATGHLQGTITINVAEADDAARHAIREQLQERYRTVLGHLRHEAGHFYFGALVHGDVLEECRSLFGDERADYQQALQRYYDQGPRADWPEHFVSAYASAHPAEDFAETFAHVLHIEDALETARETGLAQAAADAGGNWIDAWVNLAITLNEVMRSLGSEDPYPFVLSDAVRRKLEFVSRFLYQPA